MLSKSCQDAVEGPAPDGPGAGSGLAPASGLRPAYTWNGLSGDANFGTGNNWQGGAVPGIGSGVTLDFTSTEGMALVPPYNPTGCPMGLK